MISGLESTPEFISKHLQERIVTHLDSKVWDTSISRRTQHYGMKYQYRMSKSNDLKHYEYEGIIKDIGDSIDPEFNMCIVNEYLRGQQIASHIDNPVVFGDKIAIVSLLSPCMMIFSSRSIERRLFLEPLSLTIMSGEARYKWKHSITIGSYVPKNYRRISLTYRKISS